jgi:hypothetical protein
MPVVPCEPTSNRAGASRRTKESHLRPVGFFCCSKGASIDFVNGLIGDELEETGMATKPERAPQDLAARVRQRTAAKPMTFRHLLVASAFLAIPLALGGCAPPHTWTPGRGTNLADFAPAKARCSIFARHGGSNFFVSGSPSDVAGATLGHAIGETARAQQDFGDCMVASGWRLAADDDSGVVAGDESPAPSPSPEVITARAEFHADWEQGQEWARQHTDAICYEPPANVKHPDAWATGCGAMHKEPLSGRRPPEASADTSKGLDSGLRGAACEAAPAGIEYAADWMSGCGAGRMERVLERQPG